MSTRDLTSIGGPCATNKPVNLKNGGKEVWYWHKPEVVAVLMFKAELLKSMMAETGGHEHDLQDVASIIRSSKKEDLARLEQLTPPMFATLGLIKSKVTMVARVPPLLDPSNCTRWQAFILNEKNMPSTQVDSWMSTSTIQAVFMKSEPRYTPLELLIGVRSFTRAAEYDLSTGETRKWKGEEDYKSLGFVVPTAAADQCKPISNKRAECILMMKGIKFRVSVSTTSSVFRSGIVA